LLVLKLNIKQGEILMKKQNPMMGDIIWGLIILLWIVMLVVPLTRDHYFEITKANKYLVGFFNFAILASMGDLLAGRIGTGKWTFKITTFFKMLVWGFIGLGVTLFFGLMLNGVTAMQNANLLPFKGNDFAHAFMSAVLINISFGPAMFIFHKFTDAFIDAKYNKKPADLNSLTDRIDWKTFFKFTVLTTVPFFWIPCHTIDFLLPENYRVLVAAFLSIALGLILSLSKKSIAKAN
jgi:hypothetical protein